MRPSLIFKAEKDDLEKQEIKLKKSRIDFKQL
jgi:hypothetical protein